ncbi:MAG: hypothetical protein QXW79_01150 [Thermoplasmata archaeon]
MAVYVNTNFLPFKILSHSVSQGKLGCVSPSAKVCPTMTFICNQKKIGSVNHKMEETLPIDLGSGTHGLVVETDNINYAYSVWLIGEKMFV